MKGNIRVFARIRPTLAHDHDAAGNEVVKAIDDVAVEAMVQGTQREFEYDFVFAPGLSPERVYKEVRRHYDTSLWTIGGRLVWCGVM